MPVFKSKKFVEITVYSAFWCPDCRVAKRFLEKHNIPYKEIDIESTPDAAAEVIQRTGKRAIPQFVIDGAMSERLGIKNP